MSEIAKASTRRSRSWQEVRATRKPREDRVAAQKDRMLAETRALRLREMRDERGLTQLELAARMHVTQPSVSALERGDLEKAGLATIKAYVEALGGKVEMIADFGDHRVVIG
jgi:DNA-binding XRE family transcriptional regulator